MGTIGRKMTRQEATEISRTYGSVFETILTGFVSVTLAGSYRRNKMDNLGDIDMVIITDSGEFIASDIHQIDEYGVTIESAGKKKFTLITKDGIQIDAYACSRENYGAMLFFLTGSANFNIQMRRKAKDLGYKLSQYGLFDASTGELVASRSEEDLFNKLRTSYVPPARR